MQLLREHQLNVMLFMCGVCGILAVMTLFTRSLSRKRKRILAYMEVSAMLLLMFDRASYIYRGDPSLRGYYMVRIGNGTVFFLSLLIPFLVTRYLADLYANEGRMHKTPVQLKICDALFILGTALLTISQFTGLYYTFDKNNNYQRSSWYILCYVIPFLIVILQESTLIMHRSRLKRHLSYSLIVSIALPTIASVIQFFYYGVSLTNLIMAFVVTVFYTYSLIDLNEAADKAREHEIEFYKKARRKESEMFEETMEALANAIDAKDKYTRGHSARVAVYSKRIAKEAGLSERECDKVYFAALLHDVGKIGIRHGILNKEGRLTDEEFEQIMHHPIYGEQILSGIKQAPFLKIGAHYHHERYDGKGYPEGLKGKDIPEIARIIAVADAYDAMTSLRSYREPLKIERVKEELEKGMGTQFDPEYAAIMLRLIEENETTPQKA